MLFRFPGGGGKRKPSVPLPAGAKTTTFPRRGQVVFAYRPAFDRRDGQRKKNPRCRGEQIPVTIRDRIYEYMYYGAFEIRNPQ